jgi:hypothetical protein
MPANAKREEETGKKMETLQIIAKEQAAGKCLTSRYSALIQVRSGALRTRALSHYFSLSHAEDFRVFRPPVGRPATVSIVAGRSFRRKHSTVQLQLFIGRSPGAGLIRSLVAAFVIGARLSRIVFPGVLNLRKIEFASNAEFASGPGSNITAASGTLIFGR